MWPKFVGFLLIGYLCLTKSFAYLGFPPAKLFIGEIALAAFIIAHPTEAMGRWFRSLTRPSPFSAVAWAFYVFLAYGLFQVVRGVELGYSVLSAMQNLVFNYYVLIFFLGLWVGARNPQALGRYLRLLAWCNGIYGVAYILVLSRVEVWMPGAPHVPVFGQPNGSVIALLGLLAFSPSMTKVWPLLALNAFILLGMQVRSDWLGMIVGLLLWGVATQRLGRVFQFFATGAGLMAVGYAIDFSIPSSSGRGGEISARGIIGRAIASVDPDLAARFTPQAEIYAGTVSWRTEWWNSIWASVHADPTRTLLGHGYGFPLWDLVDYVNTGVRTPHNVFYYALGYGGWIGVVLFFALQLLLARLLWTAYRISGQPFGIMYWGAALTSSFFGNYFETPFGAVPFFLLMGLSAAPALTAMATAPAPVPAARRTAVRARRRRLAAGGWPPPRSAPGRLQRRGARAYGAESA